MNWRIFTVLLVAGLLGVLGVLPLTFEMLSRMPPEKLAAAPDLPLPLVIGLSLLQNAILLSIAIAIGLRLSGRVGLQMPLLRAWATGQTPPSPAPMLRSGALVGAGIGTVLIGADAIVFLHYLPASILSMIEIPLWKRLLAGIAYGGIVEELLMRLFLLSLVAWLLGRWWKGADGMPTPGAFWAAIIVTAILFGAAHLPATAAMAPLTGMLVLRALLLNGLAGIGFGYLYWRRGLEAAMVGHMCAHLVMQIPGALLLGAML